MERAVLMWRRGTARTPSTVAHNDLHPKLWMDPVGVEEHQKNRKTKSVEHITTCDLVLYGVCLVVPRTIILFDQATIQVHYLATHILATNARPCNIFPLKCNADANALFLHLPCLQLCYVIKPIFKTMWYT